MDVGQCAAEADEPIEPMVLFEDFIFEIEYITEIRFNERVDNEIELAEMNAATTKIDHVGMVKALHR